MKGNTITALAACAAALALTSCGSTSELKPTGGATPSGGSYDNLVVLPFRDATAPARYSTWTPQEQKEYRENVIACGKKLASKTIGFAEQERKFKSCGSAPKKGKTLVVSGEITKYNDGVASLRLWIGMGAGSSSLEGVAHVKDGTTGREVGSIVIDKNSWPLGGAIAATQTADSFTEGAARKISQEVGKLVR